MGRMPRGSEKIVISRIAERKKEYLIPKGKHVSVQEGDRVAAVRP